MVVKTTFSTRELTGILSHYDLGAYIDAQPLKTGAVQTNYVLYTTGGRYVFRYYENRSTEAVRFETDLLTYLKQRMFPCPQPLKMRQGTHVGIYNHKPYVIFEFVAGSHIEHPTDHHFHQLIHRAAELHLLTRNFRSRYTCHRWNYSRDLARALAHQAAERIGTPNARAKRDWFEQTVQTLRLPPSLPKGICHCDFHFSNVLFQGDTFASLLDFDDANYTYLVFDLVGLIEQSAWHHEQETLHFEQAQHVVGAYTRYRPLNTPERRHLIDVYKLSILFDCIWWFERGDVHDFKERRKIEFLDSVGRQAFYERIFSEEERRE